MHASAVDRTKLTPPELARLWRVSPDKILAWINRGELRAVNVATRIGGRPRWLIDAEDVAAFEQARSATPRPAAKRRRRQEAYERFAY